MRLRPIFALSAVAAFAAGCGNSVSYHGKAIPPIAVIQGPGAGPATTTVEVDGTPSYDPNSIDGPGIYTWEWTLYSAPAGSNATIAANPNDGRYGELTTDVAGKYVVQLRVRDINDFAWSEPTLYTVYAFDVKGFTTIIRWNTATNDVDQHLVNETDAGSFFMAPGDCFFQNLRPDWTPMGSTDGDPNLHHDEVNGYGPEVLELPKPPNGNRYHLYVHYFSDDGLGPTDVTVEVWGYDGVSSSGLIYTNTHQALTGNQVWDVGTIDWNDASKTATVTPVDAISTY